MQIIVPCHPYLTWLSSPLLPLKVLNAVSQMLIIEADKVFVFTGFSIGTRGKQE